MSEQVHWLKEEGITDCSIVIQVAPWWEASQEGAELMLKYGVEYGPFNYSRK